MTALVSTRFRQLERVIEKGMQSFVDVGLALTEIRTTNMWREHGEYATFADYCHERWGFNDSRARQLIAAAKTVEISTVAGLPSPQNEGQAKELSRADEPAKVWAAVVAEHEPADITAAVIREHVQRAQDPIEIVQGPVVMTEPREFAALRTAIANTLRVATRDVVREFISEVLA